MPARDLTHRLIDRIDNAAALPDDPPGVRLAKTVLIFVSAAALLGGPWAAWALRAGGLPAAAAIAGAYALLSAAALAHLLLTKRPAPASYAQLVLLLAVPFAVQWTAGGFSGSGGAVLWGVLSPVCALVFAGTRAAAYWFGAYALLVVASALPDLLAGRPAPQAFVENVALVASILFFAMRYFIEEREKARAALAEEHRLLLLEQEKSERLLLNILPKPIAERLKARGGVIADGFAQASVLFSDIVGFTPLSATLAPADLVKLLNRLFSAFDELAETNGVEKIKTIGDAYMVCAGLPEPASDHAARAAEMALGMRDALARFNAENKTALQVRIGINSGPVVAGVIGLKKFVYDLWGDTVNTASRMESHSVAGCIQVTEATRDLLAGRYVFEDRGEIKVKGIGSLRTYFLLGRKAL